MINICIHLDVPTLTHGYNPNMALILADLIAHYWLKSPSHLQGSHSSDQGRVRGVPTLLFLPPLSFAFLSSSLSDCPLLFVISAAVLHCWPLVCPYWSVTLTRP